MSPEIHKLFCFICLVMGGNRSAWTQEGVRAAHRSNVVYGMAYDLASRTHLACCLKLNKQLLSEIILYMDLPSSIQNLKPFPEMKMLQWRIYKKRPHFDGCGKLEDNGRRCKDAPVYRLRRVESCKMRKRDDKGVTQAKPKTRDAGQFRTFCPHAISPKLNVH
ncbi:hypothetical protein NQ318_023342 [Aromia moschata]|uniref:Uncharacterized protein n=1 Tax=Aromia moschata TaxID=1265417 RepID=A0AAV8X1B7_9CUCU|nr:hypothetical protein NQ318_023342 [Aromia moschata]